MDASHDQSFEHYLQPLDSVVDPSYGLGVWRGGYAV